MRSSKLIVGVTAAALLAAVAIGWLVDHSPGFAQGANAAGAPPFDLSDSKVIGEGAQLFRQTCTGYCHGKDGGPSRAPKLRGAKLERSYIYGRITKGSPNGMPGFETIMPRENIWKLVAYVLSLAKAEDP
ncbi:MAG TPA: cytochrome c [Methylomirabilota bacterium]|jgi:cytochrome c oxidase cbb3-type subunit III|nr:cytochrome c [Methylomirabilota bacterium]